MSVIRFTQIDRLRLGSPLSGLFDCPDWLRRIAESAVRRAVGNVIEAAIASQSHFLVISGPLAESSSAESAAVSWLAEQLEPLHQDGITLVLAGNHRIESPIPKRLRALRIHPDEQLLVSLDLRGRPVFNIQPGTLIPRSGQPRSGQPRSGQPLSTEHQPMASGELSLRWCSDRVPVPGVPVPGVTGPERNRQGQLACLVFPSGNRNSCAASSGVYCSQNGELQLVGQAPQAIRPQETGACGCFLVEADFARSQITARFCPTDVVRFALQSIQSHPRMTAAELTAELVESGRSLNAVTGRTTVLDFEISGELPAERLIAETLSEQFLLSELRNRLDGGHSGIWPRRIHYTNVQLQRMSTGLSPAVEEFLNLSAEQSAPAPQVIAGLEFLARAV